MRQCFYFRVLIMSLLWWVAALSATHAAHVAAQTIVAPAPPADTIKPIDAKSVDKPIDKAKTIALILPLASKSLGRVAEALKNGFIAAAEVTGRDKFVPQIYLADDDAASLSLNYRKAVKEGAAAIVAGFTREGANVVSREAGYLPTLALNTPSELIKADANNFFHISLSLDNDARLVARAAQQEGFRHVLILASQAAMSKRIQVAFEKEWLRLGGTIVSKINLSGDLTDGVKIKSAIAALDKPDATKADLAFIAADMQVARFARPYLPQGMPVFATAQTFDPRAGAIDNLDLDSVKYLEKPWFAERDHAAVMAYPRPTEPTSADYERLYALGIDAWRVMLALLVADKVPGTGATKFVPLDGVTGRITLEGNQLNRGLTLLEMRDGKPQLVKSAE
jgi:uncharacterized protein